MTTMHAGLPIADLHSEQYILIFRTTLPVPPSTNNLYVNGRGGRRFKSPRYKAWLKECALHFRTLKYYHCFDKKDKAKRCIILDVPINYQRDLDNVIKPTLDALKQSAMIPDDRWVNEIHAYRATPPYNEGGERMAVRILKEEPLGEAL